MRNLRLLSGILFTALSLFFYHPAAQAQLDERILNYHSDIVINADTTMMVTETIKVLARGIQIDHGIYRDFPTKYKGGGQKTYVVGFELLEVTRDGVPEPYHLASLANGVRVFAGSSTVSVPPGEHTYTFKYLTNRQLGFFDSHDELYWNITGTDWMFEIESASATITLPVSLAKDRWQLEAYTGRWGWKGADYQAEILNARSVHFETTRGLGSYEGLTVVVMIPKGVIEPPTTATLRRFWLADHRGEIAGLIGLLILFVFLITTWALVGVDPPRGFVTMEQAPPAGLSPAAIRYIREMGSDYLGYSTALVSLAVKGHLILEVDEDDTFSATKVQGDLGNLYPEEKALLDRLFMSQDLVVITQDNHPTLGAARDAMNKVLSRQCRRTYFFLNRPPIVFGWLFAVVVAIVMVWQAGGIEFAVRHVGLFLIDAALVILNIVFVFLLPRYTKLGRLMLDKIEGFTIALSYEKAGNILDQKDIDPRQQFESYLPYAIALNRQTSWSAKFERMLRQRGEDPDALQPYWYSTPNMNRASYTDISSTLATTFSHTITTASSPPSSSSGGGGSGSSGGGGGGGGGGGW